MSPFNRYRNVTRGMRRGAGWLGGVAITALMLSALVYVPTYAQLQQSGGSGSNLSVGATGVAAPGSATLVGGSDGTNLRALSVTSAGLLNIAALPTGANTIGAISNSGFSINGSLPAGTNVIGVVNSIPKTACGNTVFSQALAAVPTSSTAVASATTCVIVVLMNNTTGASVTVSVSDNQGTPVNDVLTFSIPPNSQLIQPLYGVQFTSGIKWSASASGATGAILGYQ